GLHAKARAAPTGCLFDNARTWTRCLAGLLARMLPAFHGEIRALLHLVQLARIALAAREPVAQALLQPFRGRHRQRTEVRLDGEEIAHGVALHHRARAADEPRRAVGLRPR